MAPLALLLLGAFVLLTKASAECQTSFAVHEAIQAPQNVLTLSDGGNTRQVKAKTYSVNNCNPFPGLQTGRQYVGNYTLMGHRAYYNNTNCLIKRVNGESIYDSMQAIVITTNGWSIDAQSLDLDDMDAQQGVPSDQGWKESMALFGIYNGVMVKPQMKFYENTVLASNDYKVPRAAMQEMGLSLGDSYVPGGEYAAQEMMNCPFGRENEESKRCRMTASFPSPVDTIVVLYAAAQKSPTDPDAAVFFSEILMGCGCRCSQTASTSSRKITGNIPGVPTECVQTDSTSPQTQCDLMGNKWCTTTDTISYGVTGEQLPNGNFPCSQREGQTAKVVSDFTPREDFAVTGP